MPDWSITLTRNADDDHVLSFDVWAKWKGAPQAAGDGTFVANVPIGTADSSASYTWTAPQDGPYYFLVIPIRNDQIGRETVG